MNIVNSFAPFFDKVKVCSMVPKGEIEFQNNLLYLKMILFCFLVIEVCRLA